jgi:hypothetical protein
MAARSYWIGVVSSEHVMLGVKGSFMKINEADFALIAAAMGRPFAKDFAT